MYGFFSRLLVVDLSGGVEVVRVSDDVLTKFVGGAGLGIYLLYKDVEPGISWDDPRNEIIIGVGPLNGTIVGGTGTFSVVTKGPMTNGAVSTQANGFLGAYLKLSGFDGLIIRGRASNWVYLIIHNDEVRVMDASHLRGKDTWETEDLIKEELSRRFGFSKGSISVFSIGPAGENLVRFAALVGDHGHVASKGGVGAVFGVKRLKAIAVVKGDYKIPIANERGLREAANELFNAVMADNPGQYSRWGVAVGMVNYAKAGLLPVRNYQTSVFPIDWAERLSGQYMRTHFEHRVKTCWACRIAHNRYMRVTEGPYKGFEGEEPDYEGMAAFGPQIYQSDAGAAVMLNNLADRLGMDLNETSWVVGFLIEAYERGLISEDLLGDLRPRWGDPEFVRRVLTMIANREGIGNLLAEGVKRAAERIGGEALNIGIYTLKGNSPRSHDHRARWLELIDTAISDTSTHFLYTTDMPALLKNLGIKFNPFSPDDVVNVLVKYGGFGQFEDSLVICKFNSYGYYQPLLKAVNAVTGWSLTLDDALTIGKRIVNLFRAFNIRHGVDPRLERPSPRYGSTPIDGPAAGIGIMEHWDYIIRRIREGLGWDVESGKPLPETLKRLGLDFIIKDLWG